MKILVVQRPNENENEEVPWDEGAIKRFKLDSAEISVLITGATMWRDDVAFEVEDMPTDKQ